MATSDIPGEIEQTKRRQGGAIPAGIGLTPEQQKAQADVEWRQGAQQRQAEFKRNVGEVANGIGDAVGMAARSVASFPLAAGRGIANANVYDRPFDYSTPAKEAGKSGPTPQQQAGGIAAYDIAQRAVGSARQPFNNAAAGRLLTRQQVTSPAKPGVPETPSNIAPNDQSSGGAGGQPASDSPAPPGGIGQWSRTGIGRGRAGGEIVGRMGAEGVPEFSNATGAVAGSGPQRAVGRVGDGIGGGLSVGADGDAALATQRLKRANDEREKAIAISRRGGIGEGGGLVVVKDSGRGFKADREAAERRAMRYGVDERREELGLRRRELDQQGIEAGLDRALRERELAGTEQRNVLEGQRTQQELEAGALSLAQQRQIADLYARYEQAPPEDRAALAEQIHTLTGKEAPNRFTVVSGGQEYDMSAGALVNRPSRVFNNQTGQFVDGGVLHPSTRGPVPVTAPKAGDVDGGYKFLGGDPRDPKSWRKV